jgi:UDP-2,3-diacylglucosamine pyrophosphatase LpxH
MICIADIHIRPGQQEDSRRFIAWLEESKACGERIYILGDLFDYWFTGIEPELRDVLDALSSPQVFIIPGNRDFLLSNRASRGITILGEEEIVLSPSSQKVLLAHGHTLTEDDCGFKILHALGWPVLKLLDRALKGPFKDRFARLMVSSSAAVRPPRAVIDPALAGKRKVDMIICGHLHRMLLSERLIVLPPFFDSEQWLVWDEKGCRIEGGA